MPGSPACASMKMNIMEQLRSDDVLLMKQKPSGEVRVRSFLTLKKGDRSRSFFPSFLQDTSKRRTTLRRIGPSSVAWWRSNQANVVIRVHLGLSALVFSLERQSPSRCSPSQARTLMSPNLVGPS